MGPVLVRSNWVMLLTGHQLCYRKAASLAAWFSLLSCSPDLEGFQGVLISSVAAVTGVHVARSHYTIQICFVERQHCLLWFLCSVSLCFWLGNIYG
jgi:hypothetical protein